MAVTAIYSANEQRKQGAYKRDVGKYNARVAANTAESTRNAGVEAENIQREKTAQLLAKQRAQLGAANIQLDSGSALQLQEDAVAMGEADALRIRDNFEGQASALNTQADLLNNDAAFQKQAGNSAAFGTLLGGTADVAGTGVADSWFTPESAAMQDSNAFTGDPTFDAMGAA